MILQSHSVAQSNLSVKLHVWQTTESPCRGTKTRRLPKLVSQTFVYETLLINRGQEDINFIYQDKSYCHNHFMEKEERNFSPSLATFPLISQSSLRFSF